MGLRSSSYFLSTYYFEIFLLPPAIVVRKIGGLFLSSILSSSQLMYWVHDEHDLEKDASLILRLALDRFVL